MSKSRRCQPLEVDGKPVTACGPYVPTAEELQIIREFGECLRGERPWSDMMIPRPPQERKAP